MKILTLGVIPTPLPPTPLRATCNHCKTEIEFSPNEARQVHNDDLLIDCPLCFHTIRYCFAPLHKSLPPLPLSPPSTPYHTTVRPALYPSAPYFKPSSNGSKPLV